MRTITNFVSIIQRQLREANYFRVMLSFIRYVLLYIMDMRVRVRVDRSPNHSEKCRTGAL